MVREKRPRNRERAEQEDKRQEQSIFHGNALRFNDRSSLIKNIPLEVYYTPAVPKIRV
jgi:hypothetical protein